jgi:hypothetical protein
VALGRDVVIIDTGGRAALAILRVNVLEAEAGEASESRTEAVTA